MDLGAGVGAPDARRAVVARGRHGLSVRAEGRRRDGRSLIEHTEGLAVARAVKPRLPVAARGEQEPAVRTELDVRHRTADP